MAQSTGPNRQRSYQTCRYLLVHNCDGEWRRSEIRKEVLKSDEWLTLAREIAGKIEDAPEPGGLKAATWDAIEISFLSEERVQIRNGATTETRNYTEFGKDGRSGKPNLAWKTLLALAAERGILQDAAKTGQKWLEVERRIQEIRKVFGSTFSSRLIRSRLSKAQDTERFSRSAAALHSTPSKFSPAAIKKISSSVTFLASIT